MVIHASNEFKKRFRCKLSLQGQPVVQSGRLDAWSGHFIRLGTTQMALMMNDATLWSLILPAKGLFNISDLLKVFLPRVAELWRNHGAPFDADNQSVLFLSRSNRSLIGSMNDAIHFIRVMNAANIKEGKPQDWAAMEKTLSRCPYSTLNYSSPDLMMRQFFKGQG